MTSIETRPPEAHHAPHKQDRHNACKWRTIMILLMLVSWCGIYCFARGFLLTRLELETKATCAEQQQYHRVLLRKYDRQHHASGHDGSSDAGSALGCSGNRRQFDRVVLFIIDALRFDFLDDERRDQSSKNDGREFYVGHLPFCREKMRAEPERSLLFQFVADAPTTTSQRLKGMTTGSLPTFVDAGKNFDSDEVLEDNFIYQLVRNGRRIVALGDETWKNLFPAKSILLHGNEQAEDGNNPNAFFARSRLLPSFNVWDLHTVDDGVLRYLDTELTATTPEEIKELYALHNETDHILGEVHDHLPQWDMLIAHFLGVDHAGHRYGVHHSEMRNKLQQMNQVLERTVENLPENTLVLVFGDHGMNDEGDHGGGSDIEVNSALFAYSRDRLITDLRLTLSNENKIVNGSKREPIRRIMQTDLVPSISFLLDTPIPFGNLGMVNPELALGMDFSGCRSHSGQNTGKSYSLWQGIISMHINAAQIMRYLESYHEQHPQLLPHDEYQSLREKYKRTSETVLRIGQQLSTKSHNCADLMTNLDSIDLQQLVDLFHDYTLLCGRIATLCRERWAKFDEPLMYGGMAIMTLVFIVMIFGVVVLPSVSEQTGKPTYLAVFSAVFIVLILLTMVLEAIQPLLQDTQIDAWVRVMPEARIALVCIVLSTFVIFAARTFPRFIPRLRYLACSFSFQSALSIFVMISLFASLQSNSFIVYEDRLILFFLVSFGLVALVMSSLKSLSMVNVIIVTIFLWCVRLSSQTIRFRSHGTHHILSNQSTAAQMDLTKVSLFVTANAVLHMVYQLRDSGKSKKESDKSVAISMLKSLAVSLFTPVMSILIVLYWFINKNMAPLLDPSIGGSATDISVSLPFIGMQKLSLVDMNLWLPRMVYFIALIWIAGIITTMLLFARRRAHANTLLSMVFTAIQLPLMMLKGHTYAPVFLLMTAEIFCFVAMVLRRIVEAHSPFALVSWYLIAVQFFFATGQQNTFNTIQWTSAFVGIDELQILLSGVLVMVTAFSTKLLNVLTLPWAISQGEDSSENVQTEEGDLKDKSRGRKSLATTRSICIYWLFHLFLCIGSTLCVMIQRRHLMVWSIFAPKFIFDVLSLGVVTAMVLINMCFV